MNALRRKNLNEVISRIEELSEVLEELMGEEEEYRDNMPENLQGGARWEKADQACNCLQDALDNLEEAVSSIDEAAE